MRRIGSRFETRAYVLAATTLSIAVVGVAAVLTHSPMVFPSLGPTAFMLFAAPLIVEASPRNVFCGHLVGVLCGVGALAAFGLLQVAPDLEDITWRRLGALTVALAVSIAVMMLLDIQHAPAIATTLIVALGLIRGPARLGMVMLAVLTLIVLAAVINRLHGVRTPLWAPAPSAERIPLNVT